MMTTRLNINIDIGEIIRVNNRDEIYEQIQILKDEESK